VSQETTNHSFDELASGLASGSISRGKALRLMGAALVGGTLGSLGGVAAADEECKPLNKKCRKNSQCCSGNCSKSGTSRSGTCACQENGGTCGSNSQCCSGSKCSNGTCVACLPNSLSSTCTDDSQCCSGICNTTSSGSCAPCRETFARCTSASDCCSGICSDSGFCDHTPATVGTSTVRCFCNDGAVIDTCLRISCTEDAGASSEFCTTACASHGGRASDTCSPRGFCGG
jgi:hypothetical protein